MELGIRGRKAIVNGASAGMGKEAAMALAREGVDLCISARGAERLEAAAREIAADARVAVVPIAADHSTEEGRERILAACPDPDILVATCSPPRMTPDYRDIEVAHWREALDVGLLGPVQFMHSVLEGMVSRGWGRIVHIASVAAKYPLELRILSGGPRAALANYCGAVGLRVIRRGVTINTVLPGMFHTAYTRKQFRERAQAAGSSYDEEVSKFSSQMNIAAGRFGDAEDVGSLVAWLCSRHASYITGQSIVMDGGANRSTF